MTDLTPQEIIDQITRGLEETRKQFARPKSAAEARRSGTTKPESEADVSKVRRPIRRADASKRR